LHGALVEVLVRVNRIAGVGLRISVRVRIDLGFVVDVAVGLASGFRAASVVGFRSVAVVVVVVALRVSVALMFGVGITYSMASGVTMSVRPRVLPPSTVRIWTRMMWSASGSDSRAWSMTNRWSALGGTGVASLVQSRSGSEARGLSLSRSRSASMRSRAALYRSQHFRRIRSNSRR
jgi:hypothetical protein